MLEDKLRKPQFQSITDAIRSLARKRGVSWEFDSHAEEEMRKDNIDRLDVQNALSDCKVTEEQYYEPFWRYVTIGPDTDGRKITVIIELEEMCLRIFVVTAWN